MKLQKRRPNEISLKSKGINGGEVREGIIIIKYNLKHFQFHWIFNQKINITLPRQRQQQIRRGGVSKLSRKKSTIAVNYTDNLPRKIGKSKKSWSHATTWEVAQRQRAEGVEGGEYLLKMPFVRKYFRCFRILKREQQKFLLLISDFALFCSRRSVGVGVGAVLGWLYICKFTVFVILWGGEK